MSQKFEIILKTVYSDRIGRRIAETNIRNFADFQRRNLSIYYYRAEYTVLSIISNFCDIKLLSADFTIA
jgi:hypothetical protein